ncbi:hypothetical protein HanRHA438_Chr11g0493681 [Helianthus annuus]|nr:hypothetical protein HanRHA438_Chr11g0493681 [Helianthus annuus]
MPHVITRTLPTLCRKNGFCSQLSPYICKRGLVCEKCGKYSGEDTCQSLVLKTKGKIVIYSNNHFSDKIFM